MSEVLTQAQDGVLIITINRPEAKNAVNQAVAQGVAAAMEQLDNDKSLNAVITQTLVRTPDGRVLDHRDPGDERTGHRDRGDRHRERDRRHPRATDAPGIIAKLPLSVPVSNGTPASCNSPVAIRKKSACGAS